MRLHFKIKEQSITGYGFSSPVSDSIDYISCDFKFLTNEWDNVTGVYAVFTNKDSDPMESYSALILNNAIERDAHINLHDGIWDVSIVGVSPDGMRITTDSCPILVYKSGVSFIKFPEIPLDIGEQILSLAGQAYQKADEALTKISQLEEKLSQIL